MNRAWLVVALVVGCGDNDAALAVHSGSRLKLEWYQGQDGSRVPTGSIHDTQLGIPCYATTWVDGVVRCSGSQGYLGFADASCSQSVIVGAQPGEFAQVYDPTACGVARAYRAGAALTATQYYIAGTTGCTGPYQATSIDVVDSQAPPTTFAALDVTTQSGDDRLREVAYTTADGLAIVDETRDTALGVSCSPVLGECSPAATYSIVYVDAACTERAAEVYRDPCSPAPHYAAVAVDASCPTEYRFYALGAKLSPTTLYAKGATCAAYAPSSNFDHYALGHPIAPASLTTAIARAPGRRLQQLYFTGAGIAASSGQLQDTQIGAPCVFVNATDGVTRCLPVGNFTTMYSGDAACKTSIEVVAVPNGSGSPDCGPKPPPPQLASRSVTNGIEIRAIAGPHPGSVYVDQGQGCMPLTGYDVYDLGGIADPTSFMSATIVVDP